MSKPVVNTQMLYKFAIYQIKGLVSDADGEAIYIRAFDKVFYDLYGLENFSARLSKMYSNRGMKNLINKVGLEQLIALLKNPTYLNVLRDLTMISCDLARLRKQIKKDRRDGDSKKQKYAEKEFNDILKLYQRGIKSLRKELKIKDVHKAYKNKYKSLRDFTNEGNRNDLYWDDMDFSGLTSRLDDYDDPFDDDDYFGDDYNPNDSTILEDFIRELNGGSNYSPKRKRQRRESFEYADDEDDDDYDYGNSAGIDDLTTTVNNLCGHMQNLTNTVQGLASQNTGIPQSQQRQKSQRRSIRQNDNQNSQASDIADIKQCVFNMLDRMKDIDDRLSDVEEYVDDDDATSVGSAYDPDVDPYAPGSVHHQAVVYQQQELRPPVATNQNNRKNRASTSSNLINQINNSPDLTQQMLDNDIQPV